MKAKRVIKALKGKALKALKGKPAVGKAAAAADPEKEADAAEGEEDTQAAQKMPIMEARAASREVQKKQRIINKIMAAKDALAQKIKAHNATLRKEEKQLEDLRAVAKTKNAKAGRIKATKLKQKLVARAARVKTTGERAQKTARTAKKQLGSLKEALDVAKDKAQETGNAYQKAQKEFADANKRCKELSAAGEDKFTFGGKQAMKNREALKVKLAKMKAAYDKASTALTAKEVRNNTLKEKMGRAKEKLQLAQEVSKGNLKVLKPAKAMKAMKAKKK
jgi:chromosome segregation ATPase